MTSDFDRRELIALAGLGGLGIVFGSAIATPGKRNWSRARSTSAARGLVTTR